MLQEEYKSGWRLTDIFPVNSVGIVTARDKLAIQWTTENMERVVSDFGAREPEEARVLYELGKDAQDWKVGLAQEDVRGGDGLVCPVLYRPFDTRFTYYTGNSRGFICRPRSEVMRQMLAGKNLGLCIGRAGQVIGSDHWDVSFVSEHLSDFNLFRRGGNCLFPLYTYLGETSNSTKATNQRQSNVEPKFTQAFESAVGLDFIRDGSGNFSTTFGPEDIFNYLYAVLYSSEYRLRYADFLKSDFPRVPIPGDHGLFTDLIAPGARLVRLHLMEAEGTETRTTFRAIGGNQVAMVRYTPPEDGLPGRVWINSDQYFEGVSPETWDFAIGGYRPAEKWLKDRKGRILTAEDIVHYQKILVALEETGRLMAEIDEIIEARGGWPAAFEADKAEYRDTDIIPFPRIVEPKPEERYVTCVPFIPLRVAAGAFSGQQLVEENESFEWVAVDSRHHLRKGMFVAQVVGKSMEPAIPDSAYCLFRSPVEGTRQGKTVLVQLRDATDPDTGQRYTVKRYESQRQQVDVSWRHTRITLNPVNPDFEPIILTDGDEGELQVAAEFLEVLG